MINKTKHTIEYMSGEKITCTYSKGINGTRVDVDSTFMTDEMFNEPFPNFMRDVFKNMIYGR